MFQFQQKLKYIKGCIKKWNVELFGNIFSKKKRLDSKMKMIQQEIMTQGYTEDLRLQETNLLQEINVKDQQE